MRKACGIPLLRSVLISHIYPDPLCGLKSGRTALPKLENESAVAHCFETETGRRHSALFYKALDGRQQICIVQDHNLHHDIFPTDLYGIVGNISSGIGGLSSDISNGNMKTATSTARARLIYNQLMQLGRPAELSNNEWAKRAGVNTSFFTNLKNGSEPSIGNLRSILQVVGVSLPEFFLHESQGRLIPIPTKQELVEAISDALPGLPRRPERRASYLADTVIQILRLPDTVQASLASQGQSEEVEPQPNRTVLGATN